MRIKREHSENCERIVPRKQRENTRGMCVHCKRIVSEKREEIYKRNSIQNERESSENCERMCEKIYKRIY